LILEAFNVFNRTNFTNFSDIRETQYTITGTFPNQRLVTAAGFGTSTGTFNPRQLQLAAKIIF
jgi:hypothetical protein